MLVPLNIALGLTVPVACVIGAGMFVITVFSVNATIISGGFIVTGLIGLGLLALIYASMRKWLLPRAGTAAGPPFGPLHVLLLASNVTALVGAPLMAYDIVFSPPEAGRSPFPPGLVLAAVVACAVLSLWLLITSSRRATA